MSDTQKPLPCPFCSAAPHVSSRMDEDLATHDQVVWHSVQCVNCGMASVEIPNGYDGGTATERWNRRATPPEDSKLREALEAASHALRSYQYGNASTELAKAIADKCDAALSRATKGGDDDEG